MNCAPGQSSSSKGRVVNYYRHTVARQTHIEFNAIRAGNECFFESGERVFRRYRGCATMTDDQWVVRSGGDD